MATLPTRRKHSKQSRAAAARAVAPPSAPMASRVPAHLAALLPPALADQSGGTARGSPVENRTAAGAPAAEAAAATAEEDEDEDEDEDGEGSGDANTRRSGHANGFDNPVLPAGFLALFPPPPPAFRACAFVRAGAFAYLEDDVAEDEDEDEDEDEEEDEEDEDNEDDEDDDAARLSPTGFVSFIALLVCLRFRFGRRPSGAAPMAEVTVDGAMSRDPGLRLSASSRNTRERGGGGVGRRATAPPVVLPRGIS